MAAFDNWFRQRNRKIYQSIYRSIFKDEYPEEADPDGYVTLTDLRSCVKYLNVEPGDKIIDLGCGRGGPGLWIARALDVSYLGLDIAKVGIEWGWERINDFGLNGKAEFQVADIAGNTGLPSNCYDGAISFDTISFIHNNLSVFQEIQRILKPNARFIFTLWEQNLPKRVNDYHPLLQKTGFEVILYEETNNWKHLQRKSYQSVLKLKDKIIEEYGEDGSRGLIYEAEKKLKQLDNMRRVLIVAKKL